MYQSLQGAHSATSVDLVWYQLEETSRAVGTFQAHTVSVTPMDGVVMASRVWPRRQRAAPRHPPRPPGANPGSPSVPAGAIFDAGAGSSGDEEGQAPSDGDSSEEEDLLEGLEAMLSELMSDAEEESEASGAAASSGQAAAAPASAPAEVVAPPPPPPSAAPADGAHRDARPRRGATATVQTDGGSLSYYPSKSAFEAVCDNPHHGRCVLTRTSKAKPDNRSGMTQGGRPVGFMLSWLAAGQGLPSKAAHWAPEVLAQPLGARAAMRRLAATTPSGRTLLSCERPAAEGEAPEPEDLRAYMR